MAVREGTYKSLIQGVSQQIPQERSDGQLGSQWNMLSDPVTGLRRRAGIKLHARLANLSSSAYIRMVDILGLYYFMCIDTITGTMHIYTYDGELVKSHQTDYLKAVSKASIRSVVSRSSCYVVNTDKVPEKIIGTEASTFDPKLAGYLSIRAGAFSKQYSVTVKWGTTTKEFTFTSDGGSADQVTPAALAGKFKDLMVADTAFSAVYDVVQDGMTLGIKAKTGQTPPALSIETGDSSTYIMVSNTSRVGSRTELLGNLPSNLDGYIMAVGTEKNSSYYMFQDETNIWKEVSAWELNYTISNEPIYWTVDDKETDPYVVKSLAIKMRSAGDEENNPTPKFIGYGITGIGTYQSRLILLSGSYVNMSKTTDFSEYSRTTVTEVLDDDPIEIASASLSSTQFEYCIPYNKDLILVAQNQQAVIPANNTVLTPKTAVIYPSTKVELSLANEPQIVSRSVYYTYQRGDEYYQVGEFIPNSYTDAQYYNQNLTDHISLYAKGVCTCIASSTTNNMALMSSDDKEVLVNQFMWSGDERALMAFHKWQFMLPVVYMQFLQENILFFMDDGDDVIVATLNAQLNQLTEKPVPYLDLYTPINIVNGVGTIPDYYVGKDFTTVLYDNRNLRHYEIKPKVDGNTIKVQQDGHVMIGFKYRSEFTLTPPFLKDDNGKVIAGSRSTLHKLDMEFVNTGNFKVYVTDARGEAYDGQHVTPLTWSETKLEYTLVSRIGNVSVPCKTRLSSTECSLYTDSTTDMNLTTCNYWIRLNQRYRRV